jgi:hypothetical protein
VKALWFLWSRQMINGLKRAVKTPRRLMGVLLALGYFVGIIMRPWDKTPDGLKFGDGFKGIEPGHLGLAIFGIFALLSFVISLGVFNFRNTFKTSDVDVLFPTPISSKLVMFFRLFRDYAGTVLLPFIIAIFTYKPAKSFFSEWQKGDASGMSNAIRGAFIAWVLLALAWVAVSYACAFYVAKNESRGDVIGRRLAWGMAILSLSAVAYYPITIYPVVKADGNILQTISNITNSPYIQIVFCLPHAAKNFVMGGYTGSILQTLFGFVVLGGVSAACLAFAAKHSDWMYDQAATKGAQGQKIRDLMSKGDATGILAEKARMGKVKRGRIAAKVSQLTLRNGWAMIYKELLIQARTGIGMTIFFMLMVSIFAVMFSLIPEMKSRSGKSIPSEWAPMFYLAMVGFMGANMSAATAYNGFAETLKRVEIIKPMPLNARQIAFYETISKSIFAGIVILVPFLIGFCVRPSWWQYHVSGMIAGPALAMALVGMIFLNVVLFPDLDDPSQRSIRGFLQLIGMLIVFTPTFLIFAGVAFFKTSPLIAAFTTAGINIGMTIVAATLAGRYYADFNPSE